MEGAEVGGRIGRSDKTIFSHLIATEAEGIDVEKEHGTYL